MDCWVEWPVSCKAHCASWHLLEGTELTSLLWALRTRMNWRFCLSLPGIPMPTTVSQFWNHLVRVWMFLSVGRGQQDGGCGLCYGKPYAALWASENILPLEKISLSWRRTSVCKRRRETGSSEPVISWRPWPLCSPGAYVLWYCLLWYSCLRFLMKTIGKSTLHADGLWVTLIDI